MVRFVDQICSRRCQGRLTFAELPQAWWAPMLCFGSAVCRLSAGLFHQQVSNYRRGCHESVSVWTPPQRFSQSAADGVRPSPEPRDNALPGPRLRAASRRPVVFLCQLFANNNTPHPGRPENKVQSKERESGAAIYWRQLKLAANLFAWRFYPEALSLMH